MKWIMLTIMAVMMVSSASAEYFCSTEKTERDCFGVSSTNRTCYYLLGIDVCTKTGVWIEEPANITPFVKADGIIIDAPIASLVVKGNTFGYSYNETEVRKIAGNKNISTGYSVYFEGYFSSNIPYALEKPLGYCENIVNQIGQTECREVKRYFDFSQIFKKENNVYEFLDEEIEIEVCPVNMTFDRDNNAICPVKMVLGKLNVTIKKERNIKDQLFRLNE